MATIDDGNVSHEAGQVGIEARNQLRRNDLAFVAIATLQFDLDEFVVVEGVVRLGSHGLGEPGSADGDQRM